MAAAFKRLGAFTNARPGLKHSLQLLAWAPVVVFVTEHLVSVVGIEGRCVHPVLAEILML